MVPFKIPGCQKNRCQYYLATCGMMGYFSFICYASLYPGYPWQLVPETLFYTLFLQWLDNIHGYDIIQNALFYLPMGVFWHARSYPERPAWLPLAAMMLGLSMTLELIQCGLPMRHTSPLDVFLNVSGALFGFFALGNAVSRQLNRVVQALNPAPFVVSVGGIYLIGYTLSQWYPFLPAFYLRHYRETVIHFLMPVYTPEALNLVLVIQHIVGGLGVFLAFYLLFKGHYRRYLGFVWLGGVMLIKLFIAHRFISLESMIGLIIVGVIAGIISWICHDSHRQTGLPEVS